MQQHFGSAKCNKLNTIITLYKMENYLLEFCVDLLQERRLFAVEEGAQRRTHEQEERADEGNGRRSNSRISCSQAFLARFNYWFGLDTANQFF